MSLLDFSCGLIAGWSQVITGQPLDFIKVKMQTKSKQFENMKLLKIVKSIYQKSGMSSFYRGSSSMFFGFSFIIGAQFVVYQFSKRQILRYLNSLRPSTSQMTQSELGIGYVALAGASVGLATPIIYCPVEYAKIQRQLYPSTTQGSLKLLFSQIASNGIKNLSNGLAPTLIRETIGSFIYFGSYEWTIRTLTSNHRGSATSLQYMISGAAAGLLFWIATYPIDTIKTNLQSGKTWKQSLQEVRNINLMAYRVVLLRSMIVNASSFLVYENCRRLAQSLNYYYSMY